MGPNSLVSSEKGNAVLVSMSGRSLINYIYKVGSSTLPCGIPLKTWCPFRCVPIYYNSLSPLF